MRTRESHTHLDENHDVNGERDVLDLHTSEHGVVGGSSRRVPFQILDEQRRGPTRLMSPRATFQSCGSSSGLKKAAECCRNAN
jgi:hypothetical protein